MTGLGDDQADAIREAVAEAVLAAREQGRDGLDDDPAAHLLMIAASRVAAEEANRLLRLSIIGARGAEHSWEAVGRVLGISRQAAQQRFGGAAVDLPGDTATHRVLKPLHAFNEMEALAEAGAQGWHGVDYGFLFHLVEASDSKWEHRRYWWPSRRRQRGMAERGWRRISPSAFESPWVYYKRRLDEPADPPSA